MKSRRSRELVLRNIHGHWIGLVITDDGSIYANTIPLHTRSEVFEVLRAMNVDFVRIVDNMEYNGIFDALWRAYMGEGFNEKVALDISGLSSRELAILELTKRIPRGKVTTYRRLALKAGLGNAWRYIGRIMARNRWPLIIPCHRVVRSDGSLGGYIQGFKYAKVKEEILRREGVVILRGRVLKEYIL